MKVMFLTSILLVPNNEGEAKIEKVISKKRGSGEPRDSNGNTAEWYRDMNLRVPKELLDLEEDEDNIDEDGNIFLQEHEMEYDFVDSLLVLSEFQSCVDNQRIGSVVYLKDGSEMHVEETAEEILYYIGYLTRPWNVRLADYFKNLWFKLKHFRRKKVDYKEILNRKENQPDYIPPTEENITQ